MAAYRIIMTLDAIDDLTELGDYIANVLYARDTALAYVRAIRKEIAALAEMPAVYKVMDDEPWHSRGLRRFLVKNFYVYYRVEEAAKAVYVLNVIYARRDQLKALAQRVGDE